MSDSGDAPELPSALNGVVHIAIQHAMTALAATLVGAGAIQSSQTAQFEAIGAGILLWGASLAYAEIIQYYRRKAAKGAIVQAAVTGVVPASALPPQAKAS